MTAKRVRFRRTMKRTRIRLRELMAGLEALGLARTVGAGKATRRELV